jgi:hypothetical protein
MLFTTDPDGAVYRHDDHGFTQVEGLTGVDFLDW